jgi:hypothetical protein
MRTLALLLVFATSLFAYQAKLTGGKNGGGDNAAKRGNQTHDELDYLPSPVRKTFDSEPPKKPNESIATDSPDDPPKWINGLNAVSTAVIAVFTVLLFVAVAWQIRTSKQSERAWVAVKRVGNPLRCYLHPFPPTEQQLSELRDRDVLMCAYGYVKYLDAFGESRETRVCYVYDFIWGGVLTSPDEEVLNPSGFRPAKLPEYNDAT